LGRIGAEGWSSECSDAKLIRERNEFRDRCHSVRLRGSSSRASPTRFKDVGLELAAPGEPTVRPRRLEPLVASNVDDRIGRRASRERAARAATKDEFDQPFRAANPLLEASPWSPLAFNLRRAEDDGPHRQRATRRAASQA
jgi:hypothetical protein